MVTLGTKCITHTYIVSLTRLCIKEITELEYSIINYRKKIARLTKRNITLLDSVDEISAKIEIDNSIGNLNIKITPNHVLMKLGNFNYICDKTSALYNALLKEQIKSFNYVWFEEMFIFIKVGSNSYNKEGVLCDEDTMIARIKKSYYYDQQNRKERGQKEAKDRQIWYRHFDGQERIINPNSTDYLDTKDLM